MADILQRLSPIEPGDLQKQSEATAFPSHQEGSNGSVGGRKRLREDDEAKHSSNGAGSAMVTASAGPNGSGNRPPQLKRFKSQWDETPSGGELTNEEFVFGNISIPMPLTPSLRPITPPMPYLVPLSFSLPSEDGEVATYKEICRSRPW
ncbi:hypothetical protein PQX77_003115 [Marasmius sp. AFHP31]|nr:hypothetical protein PQX77_009078 [Marasmius sp. AFHP31]KAK1233713.1 hypothetical protein PQX77_003115 [Marasmius sp. AFHP31]